MEANGRFRKLNCQQMGQIIESSKVVTSKIEELLDSVLVGRSHMNRPRSIYQYSGFFLKLQIFQFLLSLNFQKSLGVMLEY